MVISIEKIWNWSIAREILGFFLVFLLCPVSPAQGDQAQYFYDELGRLKAVIDGSGNAASYTYDAVGNLLSITRHAPDELAIVALKPSRAPVGSVVEIVGVGFSETASENTVEFSSGVTAVIESSTTTTISVLVPPGVAAGPVTVTSPLGTVVSPQNFVPTPLITAVAPNLGQQGSTINGFRIEGYNLDGGTTIDFIGTVGVSVANPPNVALDGRSATVDVTIDASAPLGRRVVTITTPEGISNEDPTPKNSFTILTNEPITFTSDVVGIFVVPSTTFIAPYVGVEVQP